MKKILLLLLLFNCVQISLKAQIHISVYPNDKFRATFGGVGIPTSYESSGVGVSQKLLFKGGDGRWYQTIKLSGVFYYAYRSSVNPNNEPPCCDSWEQATPSTVSSGAWVGSSTFVPLVLTGFTCQNVSSTNKYYVDHTAPISGDGLSWATAFNNLQAALEVVGDCNDEIYVAKGTYLPSKDITGGTGSPADFTFYIKKNVKIYGGYPNGGSGARDINLNVTSLSGNNFAKNVITIRASALLGSISSQTLLDGLTIEKGNSTLGLIPTGFFSNGAGINMVADGLSATCSPTINECIFKNNIAYTGGGAIYIQSNNLGSCIPRFTKTKFLNNMAQGNGLTIIDPSITDTGGGAVKGFVNITISTTDLSITSPNFIDCIFENNETNGHGGAINVTSNFGNNPISATISSSVFINNKAGTIGIGNHGGAIFAKNHAFYTINNSVFNGNKSFGKGASLYNQISSTFLTNEIVNSTFYSNNSASGANIDNNNSRTNIKNSILWGNINEIANTSSTTTVSYSDVEGGYTGATNKNLDPLFTNISSPIGSDGIWKNADDGLHLQSTSPAINTSDPTTITPIADISNFTRIGIFDMGAYENPCPSFIDGRAYVNIAATGTNTGESWANAFTNFQSALDATKTCAIPEIWVAQGTYKPNIIPMTDVYFSTFSINSNVKIYGGFIGTETTLTLRNPKIYTTILSGDLGIVGNNTDNAFSVVTISGTNSTSVLDGFTITKGFSFYYGLSGVFNGAGIKMINGNTKINNCRFIDNHADGGGAGIYIETNGTSLPYITNCYFYHNTALGNGDPYFPSSFNTGGGAIKLFGSSVSSLINANIKNCVFESNYSKLGGAINSTGYMAIPIVVNSVFANNQALGGSGGTYLGGAIYTTNIPNVVNSTFYNNTATSGGNSIYNTAANINLNNNIFWGSTAEIQSTSIVPNITYNIIQGGFPGTGNISSVPLFVNISDLDGIDNCWQTSDDGLALDNCSPAINNGDNMAISGVTTDITNNARVQTGIVDMGAYENSGAGCGFIISVATGNWEVGSTWNIGRPPIQTEKAIIDIGHIVSVNTNTAKAKDIELRMNGNIKFATAIANLRLGN